MVALVLLLQQIRPVFGEGYNLGLDGGWHAEARPGVRAAQ